MKRLLLFVLFTMPCYGQVTVSGAEGQFTTIAAAVTACGSASCQIEVSDNTSIVSGPFSLGAVPCQNTTKPYTQILRGGSDAHIYVTGQVTLLCGGTIQGLHRDGFYITACTGINTPVNGCSEFSGATYASSVPIVVMGDGRHLINARAEDVTLDCQSVSTCSGIFAQGINENTYIGTMVVENQSGYCAYIDGTSVTTANYQINDVACQDNARTANGIVLKNHGTGKIDRITVNSNGGPQSSGACLYVTGTARGIYTANEVNMLHCEKHDDGLLVDGNPGVSGDTIDVTNGVVNAVRIAATANTNVVVKNIRNSNPGASVLINQVTGVSESADNPPTAGGVVPFWSWTIGIGDFYQDINGWHNPKFVISSLLISSTAPSISGHFNTSGDSVLQANGTATFLVTVGSGAGTTTGALTMPAATNGWNCFATNKTRAAVIQETSDSNTSVTLTNYGTAFTATNWTNGDVLYVTCGAR